jgi:hypothetical protein
MDAHIQIVPTCIRVAQWALVVPLELPQGGNAVQPVVFVTEPAGTVVLVTGQGIAFSAGHENVFWVVAKVGCYGVDTVLVAAKGHVSNLVQG